MPCFSPIEAYRAEDGRVVFSSSKVPTVSRMSLSCGQCVGCRLERSRQWAVRCMHEASLFDENCFITLTYNDEHLPGDGSLHYEQFQKFMKRLRKKFPDRKVRFFMCGEYGDLRDRPHFHACLFNCDFPDKYYWKKSNGCRLYRSETLEKLWPFGDSTVGEVTFESAAYVARYVMKKVTGDAAESHYRRVRPDTGEVVELEPEFCHMSLKPGIGSDWLRLYWRDVQDGMCVSRGHESLMPKYYRKYFKRSDLYIDILDKMEGFAYRSREDQTPERLKVREQVVKARANLLKRSIGE